MAKWVDYKQIKEMVSIEDLLKHYGLLDQLKRKGENLVGNCPIHKGTNPTQFHASIIKNNFNCFGDCHGGGNVIDFVAKMEKVDLRKAGMWIQDWFDIKAKRPSTKKDEKSSVSVSKERAGGEPAEIKPELIKEKKEENKPLEFTLKNLDQEHPYLKERGLEKETVEFFGVGYCNKGIMKERVAIPIHNSSGELVAYTGRWAANPTDKETPKYKLPAGFLKSLEVFNLHMAKYEAGKQGLILVEGLFDCMKVWQAGFRNVVALIGSSLSEEQEKLIVDAVGLQGKVFLMFDEDEAGWGCRTDVLERLSKRVYVKTVELGEEGLQPDKLSKEEIIKLLG
jgi:DNA primase